MAQELYFEFCQHKQFAMKSRIVLFVFLLILVSKPEFGQRISKMEHRLKDKIEKIQLTDSLMTTKTFVFIANRALPQGYPSVDLTKNNNYLKFDPELTESYMPYYGRAYQVDYGGDGGIKFEGKPKGFKISKTAKGYEVAATITTEHDLYQLSLSISWEGNAILSINCNQRSSISYLGEIEKYVKPVDK